MRCDLVARERLAVREVEAQAVRPDERALLRRASRRAPCAAPSGGGASRSGCAASPCAARDRPRAARSSPTSTLALAHLAEVHDEAGERLLRVLHANLRAAGRRDHAAGRRPGRPTRRRTASRRRRPRPRRPSSARVDERAGSFGAVREEQHLALALFALVAGEADRPSRRRRALRAAPRRLTIDVDGRLADLGACAARLLLGSIASLVAGDVDGEVALARDDLGEIEREAVRVVELEDDVARDDACSPRGLACDATSSSSILRPRSMVSRKRTSSCSTTLAMRSLRCDELGVRARPSASTTSSATSCRNGLRDAEAVAVTDRAAHDAAEHVRAPVAIGEDALGDEERRECARGRR